MTTDNKDKKNLILCDLSPDTNKSDIESFLSAYKANINSIKLTENIPYKALVSFNDYTTANECRTNMNQKKIKNRPIRIMWDEKDFLQNNKDKKNNLYIKGIPKEKTPREVYTYFLKFGDIFSFKLNEDRKGNNNNVTAFVTYYSESDAKKAIDETNGKKIWNSDMEANYQRMNDNMDNNFKISINNLPDNYNEQDLTKLCEKFGKIHICNINKGPKGKYAIIKFFNEQDVKKAVENLNNKEIENKKIYVKEMKDNRHYKYYKHNFQNNFYFNNPPMMRYEEPFENNNLYVKNIPFTATEEDLRKTFEPFGKITSIRLEKEISEVKIDNETKKLSANKGFGYISFEKIEDAKKALQSLNGFHMKGFEHWTKALDIDYFIDKEKRKNIMKTDYYGIQNNPTFFPGIPGQFLPYPPPIMIPFGNQNQYKMPYMYYPGNYKNSYNNNHKQKYNNNGYQNRGRGGHRGGYHKNNFNKKSNDDKKNENETKQNNTDNGNNKLEEEKKEFDYESYNKLTSNDEKIEFLGERIYIAIQEKIKNYGYKDNSDVIAKITGMLLDMPNDKDIIEILEKPKILDNRIKEALSLLNESK